MFSPYFIIHLSFSSVLQWAEPRLVKEEVDTQILALLGPKTEADAAKAKETKVKPKV